MRREKLTHLFDDLEAFFLAGTAIAAVCVLAFELSKRWLW